MATQRSGRQAVRNGGSGIPGWGLFLAGVVVGLIVMGIVAHRGLIPSLRRNDQPQANPNAVAQQGSAPGIAASSSAASSGSQFDFYKVLPEKEVVIPNAELSAMAKAEQQKAAAANNASASAPAKATAGASEGGYVLQVGAFPNAGDADAMKAKLALQGFTAHVQAVTLDGQVWNRVRIGPFASATQLQSVQKQLSAAGIHGIPLKEK
ncbi:MAG TPA: SPOR domain-containing protein [Rhodanobacteraceae bacterium]|nr:SPOR domain-containing protein [Rhodanobacteraceae bacterium]